MCCPGCLSVPCASSPPPLPPSRPALVYQCPLSFLHLPFLHKPSFFRERHYPWHIGFWYVRLSRWQDSGFFKQPGDGDSAWHQDAVACPLDTQRMVTLWIALSPIGTDLGPLQVV